MPASLCKPSVSVTTPNIPESDIASDQHEFFRSESRKQTGGQRGAGSAQSLLVRSWAGSFQVVRRRSPMEMNQAPSARAATPAKLPHNGPHQPIARRKPTRT